MLIKVIEAQVIHNKIRIEHEWLLKTADHAPEGLKEELMALVKKRERLVSEVEAKVFGATIEMPAGAEKYVIEEIKEEATTVGEVAPVEGKQI